MSIICGPFQVGTWDSTKNRYKNGHNVRISGDKKSLKIYATDATGEETTKVCDHSLVSGNFVCLFVNDNAAIVVQQAKSEKLVSISIGASKGMKTRLDEVADGTMGITSFIGTDDVRQGLYVFSNALEVTPNSGVNLRFDESSEKLIIEY
jgi:hypothetical protein